MEMSLPGQYYGQPMMMGPMGTDPLAMEQWPAGYGFDGMEACPQCGQFHGPASCDLSYDQPDFGGVRFYADFEINFLRLHMMEGAVGKLSENYEFSPRLTLGFDGTGIVDGRVRYWIYDRATNILSGGGVRVDFKVLDIEATHSFQAGRSEVALAVGLRMASLDLIDDDGDGVGNDLLGMTLAADALTPLCVLDEGAVSWVYGGRLSILGGDWHGSGSSDFLPAPLQDDNVMAEEIYVGVQFNTSYRDCDLVARLAFEIQNWHSDVLAQESGTDSIGFIGPGVHIGAAY
jgi:hypothetical protein